MQRPTHRPPILPRRAAILAPVVLALILAACGGSSPAPSSTPAAQQGSGNTPAANAPAVTAAPTGQNSDKVDVVFTQLQAIYQSQGADAAKQFARDQGLLTTQDEIRMTLVLDTDDSAVSESTALATTRIGGRVISSAGDELEIVVPVQTLIDYTKTTNRQSLLTDLADFQHVKTVKRTAMTQRPLTPTPPRTSGGKATGAKSEGIAFTGADKWQAAGITGKGVKIGVIDSSFNNYKQFVRSAKVTTRSFRSDGLIEDTSDEEGIHGTACAEIVSEMAPDAEIYLATTETQGEYVAAVRWLTGTVGVSVISASVGFPGTVPTNDTSQMTQEIDKAKTAGVFFATSAGNDANGKIGTDGAEGHFGATFTDNDKDGFHDFPGAKNKNGLVLAVGGQPIQVFLNWDDWTKPHVNYDLYLFDTNGKEVGRSDNNQATGRQPPIEVLSGKVPAGNYIVKVKKVNASDPNLPFNLFFYGAQMEQVTAPNSLSSPADAKGVFAVAAIDVKTGKVEDFSSQGTTLDGRKKPDIGAPDNNSSFAYASIGNPSFPGTSAAAPHMAGAAALFKQAFPDVTPDAMFRFFSDHAKKPTGTPAGDNISGVGVLFLDAVPQNANTRPAATRAMSTTTVAATPITGTSATAVPTATTASGGRAPTTAPTTAGSGSTGGAAFVDNFTSPSSGLPAQGYQNGQYRFRADTGSLITATYPKAVKDASAEIYEVTAQRTGGAPDALLGLEVRRLDKDNYLLFLISNDGTYAILARVNGTLGQLGKGGSSAAIKANAPNALRVSIVGTKFAFAVNGQVVSEVDISDIWTQGAFGFVGGGGQSGPADVAFANYSVKLG